VLRREATLEARGLDVFGEFSNTIGGRARAALLERDFDLHISLPEISESCTMKDSDREWETAARFTTAGGDTVFVGLWLEEEPEASKAAGSFDPLAALAAAAVALPSAGSSAAGSASVGDADVDDALC
jgi:hypothetical protein